MKKTIKKVAKKAAPRARSKVSGTHFHGVQHEFIIITGGGFLVIVLALMLFF